MVKNLPANAGDTNWIPRSGRSAGKEMATNSSILSWEIPWSEEPGGPQSRGWATVKGAGLQSKTVRYDLATKTKQQ